MGIDPRTLVLPIVGAPMAGGPSTPALGAAVSDAGGLGFIAAGYRTPESMAGDIHALRADPERPFGVNLFAPSGEPADTGLVADYAAHLGEEAERYGVALGDPRHDDDHFAAKLRVISRERVPVASFTFGCPSPDTVATLQAGDTSVWVTVTSVAEAEMALAAGADALVAQGAEAGGHRGFFADDDGREDLSLLVLLRLLSRLGTPLIAAGGIMDGAAIAAVLCAGAVAAQLGTALMLTPEAGTSAPQREALATPGPTRLTRAFSGRTARGLVNRFMDAHGEQAPHAYPEIHHLTTPVRAAARESGDAGAINLWAGQGHELVRAQPAGELVRELAGEARAVLRARADGWD
jgi:nitronate monooxygenase